MLFLLSTSVWTMFVWGEERKVQATITQDWTKEGVLSVNKVPNIKMNQPRERGERE